MPTTSYRFFVYAEKFIFPNKTCSAEGSNDEGIHIARPRGGGGMDVIARSLPMNMPKFPNDRPSLRDLDDDVRICHISVVLSSQILIFNSYNSVCQNVFLIIFFNLPDFHLIHLK